MPPTDSISVRFPDDLLLALDAHVHVGGYTNRSDLIVQSVRRTLGEAGALPAADRARRGEMNVYETLPFRGDAGTRWDTPPDLAWLLEENGVVTLHAKEGRTLPLVVRCQPPGRDVFRILNLWYRHIAGRATPTGTMLKVGGGTDLFDGENYVLDLWTQKQVGNISLDGRVPGRRQGAPMLANHPILHAPNDLSVRLHVIGAPGSFVSFQLFAVVERLGGLKRVPVAAEPEDEPEE